MAKSIQDFVTSIPDFPEKGVLFRDITTVIGSAEGFSMAVDGLRAMIPPSEYDVIVGSESRGFVFGAPVAYAEKKPFVLARKKGKLPRETISESYQLEYGTAELEMHKDSITPGQRVFIVDDLVATGGTTMAIVKMVEKLGGKVVKIGFVMELQGFGAKDGVLKDYDVECLITYPGK